MTTFKRWQPNCFVTDRGLALSHLHLYRVCPVEKLQAATVTTQIIERLMACQR